MEGTVTPLVIGRLMCRPFVPPIFGVRFLPSASCIPYGRKSRKGLVDAKRACGGNSSVRIDSY